MFLGACASRGRIECDFGEERILAEDPVRFEGVRLVADGATTRAVWATRAGLFTSSGEETMRIEEPCDALDALGGSEVVVACARRPREAKDDAGALMLFLLVDGRVVTRRAVEARVGRDHQGISLVRSGDGYALGWHDGTPGDWGAWWVTLDSELRATREPRRLSARATAAGPPALLGGERDEPVLATWAETWFEGGAPRGQVLVSDGTGRPERIAEVSYAAPTPILARDPRGMVAFFRDQPGRSRRASLFAQRIDRDLSTSTPRRRVGRSDGRGVPRAFMCGGSLVSVGPRSFGRSEILIGIHLLDEELRSRAKEQQVYQWAAQFTVADALCADGQVELLVGQRSRLYGDPATLHALPLRCE